MKTGTSPAGSRSAAAGFTLFELLVVMAIIGLVGASLFGFLIRDNRALDLDHATRGLADSLRSTQRAAIAQNLERSFSIDVERRQYLSDDADAPPIQLPTGIELRFVTALSERTSQTSGRIRFFPDGSSTGGRITLVHQNIESVIEVDWMTGLISVVEDID